MIDITGYITKASSENGFTIKVTSAEIQYPSHNDVHVLKEVEVHIAKYLYPSDDTNAFERVSVRNDYRKDLIDKCRSLSNALRPGDRVKCSVFIVEKQKLNGVETAVINTNRRDIQSYADFPLWLCPYDNRFERLEVDTPDTIKFRKQWSYTCINREKCAEIVGSTFNNYSNKWWINKHPKLIFPMIWGVRFRTVTARLWEYYKDPKNTTITRIIATVSPLIAFASLILNVWLFLRKP